MPNNNDNNNGFCNYVKKGYHYVAKGDLGKDVFNISQTLIVFPVAIFIFFVLLNYIGHSIFPDVIDIYFTFEGINTGQMVVIIVSLISAFLAFRTQQISQEVSNDVEKLKASLQYNYNALAKTRKKAISFYKKLKQIEEDNDLDKNELEKWVLEMMTVEDQVYFLPESYRNAWYHFFQEAKFFGKSNVDKPEEEIKKEWEKEKEQLSNLLKKITDYQLN